MKIGTVDVVAGVDQFSLICQRNQKHAQSAAQQICIWKMVYGPGALLACLSRVSPMLRQAAIHSVFASLMVFHHSLDLNVILMADQIIKVSS